MPKNDENILVLPSLSMSFNPAAWNAPNKIEKANCYTYALNAPQLGGRDPGKAKDPARKILVDERNMGNVEFLRGLMRDDGFVPAEEKDFDPRKNHIVALFGSVSYNHFLMEEVGNYHFLRLDHDGTWSEKPGHTPVQNRDLNSGGALLADGLSAHFLASQKNTPDQFLLKTVFAGYFRVPETGLSFRPKLNP